MQQLPGYDTFPHPTPPSLLQELLNTNSDGYEELPWEQSMGWGWWWPVVLIQDGNREVHEVCWLEHLPARTALWFSLLIRLTLSKGSFGLFRATETWRILSAQCYTVIPITDGSLQLNWATHHVWNFSYVTGRNEPRPWPAAVSGDTPEINIPHWDAVPHSFAGSVGLYFQS